MPKLTANLSAASLDKLLEDLQAYKQKLEEAPQKIVESLAEYGENQIRQNIAGITDKDGNYLAQAGSYVFGDSGQVYMEGDQAA